MNNLIVIISSVIIVIFLFLFFINRKLHIHDEFKNYINIIIAVATLIAASGILINVLNYRNNENNKTIMTLSSFLQNFIVVIINNFIEHPEMNYFYEELFENKIINNSTTNEILENQICLNIFAKTSEQILIINQYSSHPKISIMKELLIKILTKFSKSSKFRNCYTNIYKPSFAGPIVIDFMQNNFGY